MAVWEIWESLRADRPPSMKVRIEWNLTSKKQLIHAFRTILYNRVYTVDVAYERLDRQDYIYW